MPAERTIRFREQRSTRFLPPFANTYVPASALLTVFPATIANHLYPCLRLNHIRSMSSSPAGSEFPSSTKMVVKYILYYCYRCAMYTLSVIWHILRATNCYYRIVYYCNSPRLSFTCDIVFDAMTNYYWVKKNIVSYNPLKTIL